MDSQHTHTNRKTRLKPHEKHEQRGYRINTLKHIEWNSKVTRKKLLHNNVS